MGLEKGSGLQGGGRGGEGGKAAAARIACPRAVHARVAGELELCEGRAAVADPLREHARVNAVDCGNVVPLKPLAERAVGIPVAVVRIVLGDDKAGDVDRVTLEVLGQPKFVNSLRRKGSGVACREPINTPPPPTRLLGTP